jgi:hypothetical protein
MTSGNLSSFLKKINLDKLDKLADTVAENVTCGPECQQGKTGEELRVKYLNAKTNVSTAPGQLDDAAKKYYLFVGGEQGYSDYMDKELGQRAKKITDAYQERMNVAIKDAESRSAAYDGLYKNVANIYELHDKYRLENVDLELKLSDTKSDALTNDRKAYYEDQGIDALDYYYSYEKYMYWIAAIIVVALLFTNSMITTPKKIGFTGIIIMYPFVSVYILSFVIGLWQKVYNWLPKNVLVSN